MQPLKQKLRLRLGRSKSLGRFLLTTHVSAFLALVYCGYQQPICLPILILVGISGYRTWVGQVSRSHPRALQWVESQPDGSWRLSDAQGREVSAHLSERNFVAPWMTVLTFHCGQFQRRQVVLLADNCDPSQVRRLRVRLKIHAS